MDDQTIQKTDTEQNPGRTVVALFASESDAREAEQALIQAGYQNVVVTWNGEEATDTPKAVEHHDFWASVKAFFGDHQDASLYGEGLRRGQTLVTVHTDQAQAAQAVDLLDRFNPTDVDGAEQAWRGEGAATVASNSLEDVPAEDRPAYLAAAADPNGVERLVSEQPLAGGRDLNAGNARVRSYELSGISTVANGADEQEMRGEDSVLNDADENRPYGSNDDAPSVATSDKAWQNRTDGLEDKSL